MLQRYSTFLPPIFAFVFAGTLFSLFWGYFVTKEGLKGSLGELQEKFPKPDNPEYSTFYHNYQSFYGKGKEKQRERLRQIQKHLESDPLSLILKKELAVYHAWFKTVPEKKDEISRAKTIEDCLEVIRIIKEDRNKQPSSNLTVKNLYPSIYELAEYLEDLELSNQARLEELLGHTPGNFRSQLEQDYHAEAK